MHMVLASFRGGGVVVLSCELLLLSELLLHGCTHGFDLLVRRS